MKLISVRDFRTRPAAVWKELRQATDLVLTNNGKPIALVSPVTEETLEDSLKLLKRLRAAAALEKIHEESIEKGRSAKSLDEINSLVRRVRKGRRK